MTRTLVAAVALFACAFPLPADARCSCVDEVDFEIAFRKADAIFVGTVVSIDEIKDPAEFIPHLQVVLRVQEPFKNTTTEVRRVQTRIRGDSCRYPFQIGRQYLVFATKSRGALTTNRCTRTSPVAWAFEDLERLRKQ